MMKYLMNAAMLSATLLLAVSCNDDNEVSKNEGQVAFTMKGKNGTDNSSGRVMNELEITSATAAVTEVELESENDSIESEQEKEFEGQYTVDLLTGTSNPAFGTALVNAKNYNKLEIEFGTFLQDNASLIVEGTYTNSNGEKVPFKYTMNKEIEIEIESSNGFEVEAGSVKEVAAEIDFAMLFDGIDFELADANADGLVIVDASINTYVYNLISQNFSAAISLEIDVD